MMAEPAALAIDSLRTERVRSALAMIGHRHRHCDRGPGRLGSGQCAQPGCAAVPRPRHRQRVRLPFDRRSVCHAEREARRDAGRSSSPTSATSNGWDRHPRRRRPGDRADRGERRRCSSRGPRGNESDTVLVEGASPALFDIIGAEFASGQPFTELENREGARVAVVGANLARALFGNASPIGQTLTLAGDTLHRRRRAGETPRRFLRREPAGQRAQPAGAAPFATVRRSGTRGALSARETRPARGLLPAGGSNPAAAAAAAVNGRERFHALNRQTDHRDLRRRSAPASVS